ncbi:MAG: hypothetical protein HC780_14700 [Leptolyngbyaceae cyanobacterium CSU_1_3]|nr:hypothetical protein [Leptolyngbyaceae cyanobacterium CSU_1_3]
MSIHFEFLKSEWSRVYEAAAKAESLACPDPRTACFYSRRALEIAIAWLFECDNSLTQPYKTDLSAFLFEPSFTEDAIVAIRELFHFCYWLGRN